jgi:hypothetical protein
MYSSHLHVATLHAMAVLLKDITAQVQDRLKVSVIMRHLSSMIENIVEIWSRYNSRSDGGML